MTEFLPLYLNVRTLMGLTTVSSVVVILNLFQDLLKKMLKQVQHDKRKSGFPLSGLVVWLDKTIVVIPA
ncbi:hypothetical protein [Rickettsia endosymbiont of Orchestes rusci]|uniref:hypothetical protein n=1 Tax=Rickettsia endosymbiont of Orchestes rusci TaxID=3066250 RepID=UPI00313DEC92